jgi:hypothetical protein
MAVHDLLNTLSKVKQTGANRWIACCPAHDDRKPSLTITEKDDGVILLHCWAGCGAAEVLGAVGLEFDALFPPKQDDHRGKPIKRPWNPADVLAAVAFEATVVRICAADVAAGKPLNEADTQRLVTARQRLTAAAEAVNG